VFAGSALLLAVIGIYGVMSYVVTLRTQEMGVRLALGANPSDLARLVLGQAARLVATGLGLGLIGAALLTRLLSLATREHRHLSIDVVSHFLPSRWQLWLGLLVNTVALVLCMLLVQAAWGLVRSEYTAGTMLTFGVPAWLAQGIIPLGFGVITLRFALRLVETLARLLQPEARA
jgi:ABC-type antimicrobial peptide transport system permease subunit